MQRPGWGGHPERCISYIIILSFGMQESSPTVFYCGQKLITNGTVSAENVFFLLPRPADLSLSFAHRPIDDPAPILGTLVLGIADTPWFIHALQGQIGIPIGIRRAIIVDIRHSPGRRQIISQYDLPSVRGDWVDAIVWKWAQMIIDNPENLRKGLYNLWG